MTDWPRTTAVDGAALVDAVNAATGADLVPTGRLAGGNAGAIGARRGDRDVVLTRWNSATLEQVAMLERLVAAGYPIPAYELVPVPGGVAMVAERVDGVPGARPTPRLVERLLALTDRQAGLADGPAGHRLHLTEDGGGYCMHEPLRRHSPATRALLDWIEEVGATTDTVSGTDVVHYDLHLDNILVRGDDTIAGVVDWAGVRVGDRALDLVVAGFDVSRRGGDAGPIRSRLADADPLVAHVALRYVDWSIRHGTAADVEDWLAVAADWRRWLG